MITNVPPSNDATESLKQLFNGAFYQTLPVDENTYSVIYGFFLERTNLKDSADALTQTLISLCYNNKINPLSVLTEFDKTTNESNFKKILISVFNTGRTPTSKIGYSQGIQPNKWVARNIVV